MALTTAAEIRAAIPNGDTLEAGVVTGLLNAADAAVKTYCQRTFEAGNFRERLMMPENGTDLFLAEWPVTMVNQCSVAGTEAIDIWNTTAVRARVTVTPTAVVLRSFVSGSWIESELTFASYPTLSQMKTAIEAVSGWDAELNTAVVGTEPSDELAELIGPADASESKHITLYLMDDDLDITTDRDAGIITIKSFGTWSTEKILVDYDGGYSTIPADLSRGTALVAAELYAGSQNTLGIKKEKLGDYEYEAFESTGVIGPEARRLLQPYRRMLA